MSTPCCWSRLSVVMEPSFSEARSRAVPPPATMPSWMAALVALRASTMRSFFSPTSTSEMPPTLITATPPDNLARRSWSFSFWYSDWVSSIKACNKLHLSSRLSLAPPPLRIRELSFVMVICLADPRSPTSILSNLMSLSSLKTVAPVITPISSSVALRLSPKPGALTAQTWSWPRSLLRTRVPSASPSMSSAMIKRGLRLDRQSSRAGTRSEIAEIFFSEMRTMASSNSTF
eukprot:Lithocolla_globosa_v1_NODE_2031_length_2200_cov_406.434033.p2 type:complete len:232 gc:universal NODE_2031_length_2200_cov_406.434033:1822-1127(-)